MSPSSTQTGARERRLDTLAAMLAQLNRRIRAESADGATAAALRERFGPALPSIGETRTVILAQLGRGRVPNQTLLALYGALGDLSEMLTAPLPATHVTPLSRPAARKAQQRAERLEASARKMLGAIGKALAAGAAVTAASALMATPAAAGCSTVGTTTICDGDLSGGVSTGWPLTNNLTVHNLTTNIQPVGLPGVRLTSSGGNGSGGGAWSDGDDGSDAKSLDLSVSDPDNTIITSSSGGVFVYSQGGRGGNGGGAGLGGSAGDGGRGGAGGAIAADVGIDIVTTGNSVHGIVALSAGGNGGKGGSFAFGFGSAGDGGPGGAGGAVSVNFGANSIVTNGVGADGVFASSVGGNGGSAGDCDVAICGSSGGGNSAIGGTVSVTTVDGSTITANGAFSKAIRASSIGGFGGNGGDSYFAAGFASNGGSAGDGGAVYVTNGGTLTTWGVNGDAIFAQSVGGGGGDGGDTGISLFSLGGGGAQGGSGGYVQVTNESTGVIETWNTFSRGIYAQSVGGGGGAGGSASSLISVGGNGSGTSDGGAVQVGNAGAIITHGGGSQAIFAQSIGGGGGDGGGASGLAAVGGTGGSGGDSAAVTVANSGYLGTSGADASAIYAQSIGGGGGDGAGSGGMISIGGSGGAGGDSGVVTVTNRGSIQTAGDRSNGVFAQSVGGGGGNGGGAASFGAFLNISVGGAGGLGGDGDVVNITATDTSDIRTEGERSAAIFAQSVGGGGGNGGYGAGGAVGVFGALSIAVGGGGGDGGDGAAVSVHADGYLETLGADSQGVFAQSVGGGGGNGGFAVAAALAGGPVAASGSVAVGGAGAGAGDGEAVTVLNRADISTTGDRSSGLHAQSVGGGGGNGGWSGAIAGAGGAAAGAISVGVGGTAGGGGDGGVVDVGNFGDIHTRGVDAYGVLAQSVGGGGGTGGFSVSAAVGGGKVAGGLSVALGGQGGLGGDGDGVRVDSEGLILTEGDRSIGILAQSLGGGGGAGGWSGGLAVGAGGVGGAGSVTVGGFGAAGGDGWTVEVQSDTDIRTRGHDAHGVFAQSVGGGGGAGGFSLGAAVGAGQTGVGATITVGGGGGLGGDANTVTVNSTGDIRTGGDRATGITAQSLGGGGGNGGFTGSIAVGAGTSGAAVTVGIGGFGGIGGDGALVTLTSSGDIDTTGVDAQGLFAQSIGGGGGNGGFSAAVGVAAGTNAAAGSLTIGGFGGAAGDGGAVILTNTGSVETSGDRSHAVHGQSIGGGGGNGGIAASFTAAFSSSTPVSLGLNLGGFGGAGGNAAGVTIVSADATTEGDGAHAIFGQSVGGGGGTGGFSISGALSAGGSSSIALNATIGGFGGAGGDAGDVSVTADGVTWTSGEGSHGVFAQSVGGSGGDGGWAGTLTGALGSGKSVALSATLGGMGGAGGLAGDVTVNSDGQILTEGDASHAVFAQSVGGGGGTGGFTVAANFGATKATNIGLTMGGSGGGAGEAGDVFVTVTDTINTRGDGSIGVFAQSVGGGGGAGGSAGSIALSGSQSVNLTANMGGFGGTGTTGGLVDVENSGAIWTIGEMSHAIFAQSVGGGGGHGGMAGIDETEWSDYLAGGSGSVSFGSRSQNISLSMGGSGGAGNDGGEVRVENSGVIVTEGPLSHAIYAQSVGGGGGDAGVATAASGAFGAGKNGTYSVAMGGFGGTAGDGDLVEVLNSGAIRTRRDGSAGIFAQSVGGGGGAGGDARGYSMSFSPSKSKGATSVSVSLGGYGGAAGDGGEVYVENSGQILTDGAFSYGVFAQSVGGGGGTGGLVSTGGDEIIWVLDQINKGNAKGGQIAIGGSGAAGGDGGLVTVANSGLIYTRGEQAHGVFAQSVGGGGGNGGSGLAGQVSVGGQGGAAGDGGDVHVINTGAIITTDDMAKGIVAQSVGGGGGIGGATDYDGDDNYSWRSEVSATMTSVGNLQDTIDFVLSVSAPAFGIGIGGMGGAAGDGGRVTVENHGSIRTAGDFATGIFAQSVGGGGGQGGEGVFTGVGQVIFSGLGGNAGDGGDVIVTNTGDITTSGYGAYGVFAQSVGGGGGLAGDYSLGIASWGDLSSYGGEDYSDLLSLQLNPIHANGGDGGDVTVTNTGTIRVNGDGAVGIFAQSVGGGGGLFGGKLLLGFIGSMEGVGEGGRVTVIQNGDVIVAGKNAIGAVFQSASKDGDQDITATMNGRVKGGAVYGMGVLIDGGLNNTLTLNGTTWADSNLAITATGGNDTVIANKGLIGNVDLGLGTNRLTNTANSFFLSLDYVRLNGGTLVNQGLLTPGDAGTVQVTNVTGSFVQSASGEMLTDLDLLRTGKSGEIDRLNLTGSINIQGEFTLNILNPGYALPGDHTVTILDGSGTLTQSGVVLNKPTSAVASFRLAATSQDLNLNYAIDFSPTGLNNNQTALGDHINTIQLAGSSPTFAPIAAELFYVPTVTDLANIYDSFSPQTYGAQQAAQIFAGQQFADSMFSCQRPSAGVRFSESGCVWVKPAARRLELSATSSAMAFDEQSTGLSGGFEAALGGSGWRIGGALSGEAVDGGVRNRTSADGQRFQLGLVAKRDPAAGVGFGLALHGGQSEMDTTRLILLPSGPRWAEATQAISFMAATARASYRWGSDQGYLKPMLEVSAVRVETAGFTERGAGALNLVVPDQEDTYSRVSFKVEAGGEFKAGGAVVRPYGRAGVTTSADAREALFTAAFEGAPAAAAAGFSVNPGLDETTVDAEAGVAIVGPWASGRLSWTGQFGDRTDNQTLSLKLAVPF